MAIAVVLAASRCWNMQFGKKSDVCHVIASDCTGGCSLFAVHIRSWPAAFATTVVIAPKVAGPILKMGPSLLQIPAANS